MTSDHLLHSCQPRPAMPGYPFSCALLILVLTLPATAQDRVGDERVFSADRQSLERQAAPEADPPTAMASTLAGTPLAEIENAAAATRLRLNDDGGFVLTGTFNSGQIPATGAGARLMWYPARAAFRVGSTSGTLWDHANVGAYSTAMGGDTRASNTGSTAMGHGTIASGAYATAMGQNNTASGSWSTAMGGGTVASGQHATAIGRESIANTFLSMAMGDRTTASGFAAIAMGDRTTASGNNSTAMGILTTASGTASFAAGQNTTASGAWSVAMGQSASTNGSAGTFIFGDASTSNIVVPFPVNNSFVVRASGGFVFRTNPQLSTGCRLNSGSGSWDCTSSRAEKTAFEDLDGEEVLARLAAIPVQRWRYNGEDSGVRHVGPTAEDFFEAFGLGNSDESIGHIDAAGITMRAVQALEARTRIGGGGNARIEALERENEELRDRLAALESAIARLTSDASGNVILTATSGN